MEFILHPGKLKLSDFRRLLNEATTIALSPDSHAPIQAAERTVLNTLKADNIVYGINTGFGALANTKINSADLKTLQRSIVLSHAAGVGELLSDQAVRLILALKINSLARGYSGVRLQTIEAPITCG